MKIINRRPFILICICGVSSLIFNVSSWSQTPDEVVKGVKSFINHIANADGSFRPGIDPNYKGKSDTYLSGLAAATYSVILCKTFGWPLPHPEATQKFFAESQKPDGAFYPTSGAMDPQSPQAKFYNTAQSLVVLRILGGKPKYDPTPIAEYFFNENRFEKLPLYMTSFFPYFYTALGKPMPKKFDALLQAFIQKVQKDDGYLGDHVASTFHAAHYFRLVGLPTPKAELMVERVLRDQMEDGSWCLKEPDWDVHAAFDALFILRQLGNPADPRIQKAYKRATQWVLQCRKSDGGFSHFPKNPDSDMDAVYFQVGALVQTGFLPIQKELHHEEILGWGHAMIPGKKYSCVEHP